MITASDLKSNGYKISTLIAQAEIDRAEAVVKLAYFTPFSITDFDAEHADNVSALYAVMYLLLCQRNVFETRTGAVEKKNEFSNAQRTFYAEKLNADLWLRKVTGMKSMADAVDGFTDICQIYYLQKH